MSLVNILRFDRDKGAIIADEEYWTVFFRRRYHADSLSIITDEKMSEAWNLEIIYGGVGYPSIHHETVRDTREELGRILRGENGETPAPSTIEDVARIAFDKLQEAVRRRVDQKLKFYYGFDTDELNQGYFDHKGKKVSINTQKIKDEARQIASVKTKDALLKAVYDSKAVIFGHDSRDGIGCYHLSIENSIRGYVHEGFESIGAGKYAVGMSFGMDFNQKHLPLRKKGYSTIEGLVELIKASILASQHFKEIGGNFPFILLDGGAGTHDLRCREYIDSRSRLCVEIVRAQMAGMIAEDKMIKLLEELVLKMADVEKTEAKFFDSAKDSMALDLLLRNYKEKEIPEIMEEMDAKGTETKKQGKGRKSE